MANKTPETQITVKQRMVLAAVLGGTNLGMNNPTQRDVDYLWKIADLNGMVYSLWSGYMDEPGMEKGFLDECRWWFKNRKNLNSKKITVEYVRRVWPDVAKLIFDNIPAEARDNAPPHIAKCM